MVTFRKASALLSATALSVSLFAPIASASTLGNERMAGLPIQIAQTDATVTKNDLIKRVRELFPNEFTDVAEKDFQMGTGYWYPNEDKVRYELSFSKSVDNDYVYGSFTFVEETLELENFYYQGKNSQDAFFPAKYSKEEAQNVADAFIKRFDENKGYELVPNEYNYYSPSILTEPIQYSFTYNKKQTGVPISDQSINVSVLGDGTVISYYKTQNVTGDFTYDDPTKKQSETVVAKRVRDALKAELSYNVETDYVTGDYEVKLVYKPNSQFMSGVHALTGEWLTSEGLTSTLPNQTITPIVTEPLAGKQPNLTPEQATEMAKKLLAIDKKGVKLSVESSEEVTTEQGKTVYYINYMYEYKNGGTGASLTIDKATGDIIDYYNIENSFELQEDDSEEAVKLTQQQALEKATAYVKEYAPSFANQYALPLNEAYYEEYNDSYYFTFPRIVNGLTVMGDQISVSVDAKKGDLVNLNVMAYDNVEWPAATASVTQQEATKILKNQLKLELQYVNHPKVEGEQHYSLVYLPVFKDNASAVIDANTGEWVASYGMTNSDKPTIEHPTAAEELNYLIQTGVLEVDETFNPDAPITKEEALKALLKSVTYTYYYGFDSSETTTQSFTNITPEDDLYPFVTNGLRLGMLDASKGTFDKAATLSSQELAKWLVGTLNLNNAAKYSDIYQLNYSDAGQVDKELLGYVALAYKIGLLEAENNELKPKSEVTYAQLAQVIVRLAQKMNEYQVRNY